MFFKFFTGFQPPWLHYPTVAPFTEMYSAEARCFAFSQNLYRHYGKIPYIFKMSNGKLIKIFSGILDVRR